MTTTTRPDGLTVVNLADVAVGDIIATDVGPARVESIGNNADAIARMREVHPDDDFSDPTYWAVARAMDVDRLRAPDNPARAVWPLSGLVAVDGPDAGKWTVQGRADRAVGRFPAP